MLLKKTIQERETLAALYTKYYLNIKHYIASQIGSLTDAEDLAQNVFVQLCRSYDDRKIRKNNEVFLFGIARKIIARYYRDKRNSIKTVPIDSIRDSPISCEILQDQALTPFPSQQIKKLEDAIEQLPPKAQEAFKLKYVERLRPKEAARKVGCSVDIFYKRLQRAMKTLEKVRSQRTAIED
jgi:RNA polymerase sigma-70 factor (ECF subfamily)